MNTLEAAGRSGTSPQMEGGYGESMDGSLIDDDNRKITCPRCEETQPMRDFATLGMSPRYAKQLEPIYRCKQCNHLFAPRRQPQAAGVVA